MQRAWNVSENGPHFRGVPFGILADVLHVEVKNLLLHGLGCFETVVATAQIRFNRLGHAAYHHVLPGEVYCLLVDVLSKRTSLFVACTDVIGKI